MRFLAWGTLCWVVAVTACGSDSDDGGDSSSGASGGTAGVGGGGGTGGARGEVDCDTFCEALIVPRCPDGAQTLEECRPLCGQLLAADCPQLDPFLECTGPTPTFACDDRGSAIVEGCEEEQEAVGVCFEGGG